MKAIILAIGDEILIGQVVDTNSTFISKQLYSIGVETLKSISIKDTPEQITYTLDQAFLEVDLVILTGGLGPTKDDLTKDTLCNYFSDKLVYNSEIMDHINALFKSLGRKTAVLNKEQALLPEKAEILHNKFGTAPGMIFTKGNKVAISLPGVPFEMKDLIVAKVLPFIKANYKTTTLVHKTVLTYGLPESELVEKIIDWESSLPKNVGLAYLPSPGRVRIRISMMGGVEEEMLNEIENLISKLKEIIGDIIFGYDDEPIENIIANLLIKAGKTLSTAESFTGGKLASMLTSVPGSSKFFKGSVVSYSSDSKTNILKVSEDLIVDKTVVSKEVAQQMADNARSLFNSDFAISTTGVAGPDKGEDGKELGTAIIAISSSEDTIVKEFNFGQPRERMLGRAISMCFDILRKKLI